MKKRLLTLVLTLVVTSTTIMNSLSVYAQETNNDVWSQDEFIRTVDDYVEVNSEGLIDINLPKEFCEDLGEYAEIVEGIEKLNKLIEQGELSVTENGTIYETSDEEIVVQGGNVDKVVWHWWGLTRYANSKNCDTIVWKFNKASANAGKICAASTGLAYFLPSTIAKSLSTIAACGSGFAWAYFAEIANDIGYYDKGKGVKVDFTWILLYDVESQK